MIQLVAKGPDTPEVLALRALNRPDVAHHPDNHTIPLLDEFEYRDMYFAVYPLLEEFGRQPWFENLGEAIDAVSQTFKVNLAPYFHCDIF